MSRVNVNVPDELWVEFKAAAEAHYRSRSDHLRFLMAEAVREFKNESQADPLAPITDYLRGGKP